MADNSLTGGAHRLGDAGVEAVQLLYVFGRDSHLLPLAPESAGDPIRVSRAIGLLLLQPLDALLRRNNNILQRTDPRLDLGDGVLEALFPLDDDLLAMPAACLFRQTPIVRVHRGRASDMGRRQSEDAVAAASAAEEQAGGTLVVGLLEGRDSDGKRRGEGRGELGNGSVDKGVEGLQLGADTREVRLPFPDGNLDLREFGLIEDGALDVVSGGLGIVEGDRVGLHADGQEERTEGFPGPLVSPAEAHDGSVRHLALGEVCLHILEDTGPGVDDGMVVDRVELTKERLRLRTTPRCGPARARLVEEGGPADGSVGVGERVGIVC
jgi:hypothetical protein